MVDNWEKKRYFLSQYCQKKNIYSLLSVRMKSHYIGYTLGSELIE